MPAAKKPVDRGWAWIALAAQISMMIIGGGITYSTGVFNVIFLDHFREKKAATSWIGSLAMGMQYFTGPLSSILIGRLGWRPTCMIGGAVAGVGAFLSSYATNIIHLYITFGVMLGSGLGLVYISSSVALGHYFNHYRVLAFGMMSTGVGIGTIIFPLILDLMLTHLSWRETLAIVGCISLQDCVCGALMRPIDVQETIDQKDVDLPADPESAKTPCDEENPPKVAGGHKSKGFRLIKDLFQLKMVFFVAGVFATGLGASSVYLHLSAFTVTQGASLQEASLYVSIHGFSGMFSRALSGIAGNDDSMDTMLLFIGTNGLTGVCTLFFPLVASSYPARMTYACLFGIYCGANNALLLPATLQLMGLELFNASIGAVMAASGTAFIVGPPISGWLFDITGSYDVAFHVAGGVLILSASLTMLVPVVTYQPKKHKITTGEPLDTPEATVPMVELPPKQLSRKEVES